MSKPVGRPSEYDDKYIDSVDTYLTSYEELGDTTPTKEGFALFIGSTKPTIDKWAGEHEGFLYALEKIKTHQGRDLQNKGLLNKYNPTIAKLMLSSNHGMKEKTDLTSNDEPIKMDISLSLQKVYGEGA